MLADVNAELLRKINNVPRSAVIVLTARTGSRLHARWPGPLPGPPRYLDLPGSPMSANSSTAGSVERLLSFAFRFLPMLVCFRTRRFQVLRVFEAMAGDF